MENIEKQIDGRINKCVCIKQYNMFLIDDSFDESFNIGGPFSYLEGVEYKLNIEESWAGKAYIIFHNDIYKEQYVGLDEYKFLQYFRILQNEI